MNNKINRREFIQLTAAGSALYLGGSGILAFGANRKASELISPGCRGTKVKVARIYMGTSHGLWPKPKLDFRNEIRFYESEFAKLKDELADVEFVVNKLVSSVEQLNMLRSAWFLGISDSNRIHYWRFVFLILMRRPRSFWISMTLAVCGFHLWTVARGL